MAKQKIPHITPAMLKYNPDQVSDLLNRIIDAINRLDD